MASGFTKNIDEFGLSEGQKAKSMREMFKIARTAPDDPILRCSAHTLLVRYMRDVGQEYALAMVHFAYEEKNSGKTFKEALKIAEKFVKSHPFYEAPEDGGRERRA